jgi:transposase-like protein
MSNSESYDLLTREERQNRYFSEEFKRQKVADIEKKLISIGQLCRQYQVSRTSVVKRLNKYSPMRKKRERMVHETDSEAYKIKQMQERIKELERAVGQKQLKIDFLEKMIEITEQDLKIDIKKKASTKLSGGSNQTDKS